MNYERDILRILMEAGSAGLSVAKISRHVFNASNTFFETVDFEEVHRYVSAYLLRNSKTSESVVEKVARGVYRLNLKSTETQQLQLEFADHVELNDEKPVTQDLSLSLFGD